MLEEEPQQEETQQEVTQQQEDTQQEVTQQEDTQEGTCLSEISFLVMYRLITHATLTVQGKIPALLI